MSLGSATFPELRGRGDLHLVIPLGATEQHGPHLPLETDTLIAHGIAEAVAATRSDVVKALCLGARAVLIGRAYLWGLAANGQAGVENVLDILRMGLDSALLGMGVADVHDLGPGHLVIPEGFHRTLGAGG